MELLSHLCKVLLLLSIFLNFYLLNFSLKQLSVNQCLSAIREYKGLLDKEHKRTEKCLERELVEQMQRTTNRRTTTPLPRYDQEPKKDAAVVCKSLEKLNETLRKDEFLRDCVSGDIVGKVHLEKFKSSFKAPRILDITLNFDNHGGVSLGKKNETPKERLKSFVNVFESRAWGKEWDEEFIGMSASGQGSTLNWTQEVIAVLHNLINIVKKTKPPDSKVRLLDVACGDMIWMSRFLETRDDVDFTGFDIVPEIIKHHVQKFSNRPWKFYLEDIVQRKQIASYDIIVARMIFQHLYDKDVLKLLKLISNSKSSYLLTTTFPKLYLNSDLNITNENPGRFRPINLELPPFSLTHPLCYTHDGPSNKKHFVAVWKLPLSFVENCEKSIKKLLSKSKSHQNLISSCSLIEFMRKL